MRTTARTGFTPPISTREPLIPANTKDIDKVFMISKKVKKYYGDSIAAVSSFQPLISYCYHLPTIIINSFYSGRAK